MHARNAKQIQKIDRDGGVIDLSRVKSEGPRVRIFADINTILCVGCYFNGIAVGPMVSLSRASLAVVVPWVAVSRD